MTSSHEDAVLAELEATRARLAAGTALDTALEAVPDGQRDEVRALLEVTRKVDAVGGDPAPEFVARLEATLDAAIGEARGHRASRWRRWRTSIGSSLAMRAALVSATAVVLLLGTGFVAVEASSDALPGDTLYPVKEARETVERWLARSDAARLRVEQRQLDRRTDELARAVDAARDAEVTDRLEGTIGQNVREIVDRAIALEAAGHTNAVPRARQALLEMAGRLRSLQPSARTPEQRQTLVRVGLFLRIQLARLDATTDAADAADGTSTGGTSDHRPALRDAPSLRDAPTSTPVPGAPDRR